LLRVDGADAAGGAAGASDCDTERSLLDADTANATLRSQFHLQ